MGTLLKKKIVIIDDDVEIQKYLYELFKIEGHEVLLFSNAKEPIARFETDPSFAQSGCDLILCDFQMPEVNGIEFIEKLNSLQINTPVILITAHGSVETASQALRFGAFDYVTKPIDPVELTVISRRALYLRALEKEYKELKTKFHRSLSNGDIIGNSPNIQKIFTLIEKVSKASTNVLITGESGSGKELVARAIHNKSNRNLQPFIAVNCSAIPENLLESELFGHKKGSFTGANHDRRGLFEEANRGTLFLDEIGDMPLPLQSKLLRVLQERKVKPVGDNRLREIDVRIIAATHTDLRRAIQDGKFREDLFYRINVFPIEVPPLRERREDIPLLADFFLKKFCQVNRLQQKEFTRAALAKLIHNPWRGNVRELENCVERAVLLSDKGFIDEQHIEVEYRSDPKNLNEKLFSGLMTLGELEKKYIQFVLSETGKKKEAASEILGINRKTLYRKSKEYGLSE